jgi:sugar lactone lactonase YvrE
MISRILCAIAFGLVAAAASAQQPPSGAKAPPDPATLSEAQIAQVEVPTVLYQLAANYQATGDLKRLEWALQRLVVLQPNTGDLKLALAKTYALQDEKSKTYDLLLSMQKQGYGYDLEKDESFAKVAPTKVWGYVTKNLSDNLKPFGEGKIAYTLPGGDHLYESLAFDPKRGQLLVGSVRDGKVQLLGKDGKLTDFITPDKENGLWSVYAMATAPDADALYVASTASIYFKGFDQADFGKAGVFKFQLSTGKLIAKYLLTADTQSRTLSSLAVGRGGMVFAADGLRNIVYRLDGGTLKPMVSNPHFTSLRGMTVNTDGTRLYVADYALGIFGVDLAAGKGFDLVYDPAKLAIGGIDGLYWYDNTLVAIQNGMQPHRVMRLHIGADGRTITKVMPLDASKPELALPTYGAIDGDGLYFVANSQKNGYDTYGSPKSESELEAVKIYRSDLRFAWDKAGIPISKAPALSDSKPGTGKFSNVDGGSQSVTGN